jgi:hypothetical protein
MPKYEEFEAWVEIEGVRALEYGQEVRDGTDSDGAEKVVTCWVASEMNKVCHLQCECIFIT